MNHNTRLGKPVRCRRFEQFINTPRMYDITLLDDETPAVA